MAWVRQSRSALAHVAAGFHFVRLFPSGRCRSAVALCRRRSRSKSWPAVASAKMVSRFVVPPIQYLPDVGTEDSADGSLTVLPVAAKRVIADHAR